MTPQESAALERAIASAQSHPIVLLSVPSSKRASAEAEIRRIAREGLTAREAHGIAAALDTDAERRKVIDLLSAIVATPDATLLARWLMGEVKRALAEAPAAPPSPAPAVSVAWRERLKRPMLFFSAPNYYWQEASPSEVCDAILAAGLDGPSIELNGSTVVHDYIRQPDLRRMDAIMREQIDAWAAWDKAIRARGLVAHIAFLNSNNSKANSVSDAQWRAFAEAFAGRYGPANKIVLPLSETDSRTRASVGKAIYYGLRNIYPAEHLIGYGKSAWGHYTETHRERAKVAKGNRYLLQVTDNAPAIRDLYGPKWTIGGEPNLDHIRDFARRIRAAGTSGAVYSFGRVFDAAGCKAAGEGWGAASTPPVTTPAPRPPIILPDGPPPGVPAPSTSARIVSVKDARGEHISVTVEGWEGWPGKPGEKVTYAKLMIATPTQPHGVYVDAMTSGQMRGSRKTLKNAFGSGSHSLDVHKGDPVKVWVLSRDGRESNRVDWVWPYRNT